MRSGKKPLPTSNEPFCLGSLISGHCLFEKEQVLRSFIWVLLERPQWIGMKNGKVLKHLRWIHPDLNSSPDLISVWLWRNYLTFLWLSSFTCQMCVRKFWYLVNQQQLRPDCLTDVDVTLPFFHSLNRYLLGTCWMLGTVLDTLLGTRDTTVIKKRQKWEKDS